MESGRKVAAIDLGTVSSRLLLAEVRSGRVLHSDKITRITDLGQGVDETGSFAPEAVDRVVEACRDFVAAARDFGAECACTTLTSAARDADNAGELLGRLRDLGLVPQVIPGEIEARLTFFGVARDFPGERIAVADSGGGSTEIAIGAYLPEKEALELSRVRSLDIGCRRATDRFLHGDPPAPGELAGAAAWASEIFDAFWSDCPEHPVRLVAVGGTVTTLVAMIEGIDPYDSSRVHLCELEASEVDRWIERVRNLAVGEISKLKGIQAKRAPVILGGAVVIRELMRAGGYDALTVSENSLLAGAASTVSEVLEGRRPATGWTPELSEL